MTTPFDSSTTPHQPAGSATSQVLSSPNPDQQLQPPSAQIQPFPSPQTFTFLPQLYTLISRLTLLQPNGNSTTGSRASRSPTLTRRAGVTSDSQPSTSDAAAAAIVPPTSSLMTLTQSRSRDETIEIKDLPALIYPLRQQIERAKEVIKALPDVDRSTTEQEKEIQELEARIGGLKGRLGELGALAAEEMETKDVVMEGVEG